MSSLSIATYFPFERVNVVDHFVDHAVTQTVIRLEPDLRYHPICHDCGKTCTHIHSKGHMRRVRDLNMGQARNWLEISYRKVECEYCMGARVEELFFLQSGKRVTRRLARYIYGLCKTMTVVDVARHLDMDPKTIKEIDLTALEIDFGATDYSELRILAVDEIAVKKGHCYMTVVLDYLTGRVVWVGEGRDMSTLDRFFAGMSAEEKEGIEAVAMDMWEAFINRVTHHCPRAKIVFDLFHLVKAFSQVIDQVRRSEYHKATAQEKEVIKGSRYLLLTNKENLTEPQKSKLQDVLNLNTTLSAVYILKDHLKLIYGHTDRNSAKKALNFWCIMAEDLKHPALKRFIGRLRFFEYGILNHCDHQIGTGPLEGSNNKIKVIKRKAYGYHDTHYFALKIKQAFSTNENSA